MEEPASEITSGDLGERGSRGGAAGVSTTTKAGAGEPPEAEPNVAVDGADDGVVPEAAEAMPREGAPLRSFELNALARATADNL